MVGSLGSAKRVRPDQFPRQGRYGQGVIAWNLTAREKAIGLTIGRGSERVILHSSRLAPKTVRLDEAPLQTRAARGAKIFEVKGNDQIIRLTAPWQPPRPGEELPTTSTEPEKKSSRRKPAATQAQQLELLPSGATSAKSSSKKVTPKISSSPGTVPKAESKKPSSPKKPGGANASTGKSQSGKAAPATKKEQPAAEKKTGGSKSATKTTSTKKKTPSAKAPAVPSPAAPASNKKKSSASST